jgi:peptidoglycan/xylan/chitin deacetylase (PgdA/CDA1 family)
MKLRRAGWAAASAALLLAVRCGGDRMPAGPDPGRPVPLNAAAPPPAARICRWNGDRAAAYTIGFDDFRGSHVDVAWPELRKAGLVATFWLNTGAITAWESLARMADEGHEIASHTWSHARCDRISEAGLRREIERAIEDIRNHLPHVTAVPSFSYPFGLFDDASRRVVSEFHLSARSGITGIETADPDESEWTALKAVGVYPPYDMDALNAAVDEAVRGGGWIIVYFHSISRENRRGATTVPLKLFRRHLSHVRDRRADLWNATQGQAASYIRMRRAATLSVSILTGDSLEVRLDGRRPDGALPVDLTIAVERPVEWAGLEIRARTGGGRWDVAADTSAVRILLNLPVPSRTVLVASR